MLESPERGHSIGPPARPIRESHRRVILASTAIGTICTLVAIFPPLIPFAIPAIGHCLSSMAPAPLSPFHFYRFALPGAWLIATLVSYHHPGDEYGMFIVCLLPAVWIQMFMSTTGNGNFRDLLIPTLLAGGLILTLCGWVLDELRVHRKTWVAANCLITTALLIYVLSQFSSLYRATQKNGSLLAYQSTAVALSLYLTTVLFFLITPAWRAIRPWLWKLAGTGSASAPSDIESEPHPSGSDT
ncbi:MAG: hypothetical protein NT069_09300 [Planctomycetota bacterium]|nr:hypothetical protein [Planctomycetota bacterium]